MLKFYQEFLPMLNISMTQRAVIPLRMDAPNPRHYASYSVTNVCFFQLAHCPRLHSSIFVRFGLAILRTSGCRHSFVAETDSNIE